MDCRKFRDGHALFLDGQVSELDAFEMRSHMRYCADCSRYDAVLRRGQLIVRNLPDIEPSADFGARLSARIRAEKLNRARPRYAVRYVQYAAAAVMFAAITLVAGRVVRRALAPELRLPPVVATLPARDPSPFGSSALVATVPTGMSIWPAVVMASQAPVHLVAAESTGER